MCTLSPALNKLNFHRVFLVEKLFLLHQVVVKVRLILLVTIIIAGPLNEAAIKFCGYSVAAGGFEGRDGGLHEMGDTSTRKSLRRRL